MFVARLINLYSLVVLGAVVVSWLRLPPTSSVVRVLSAFTEPLLAPIRKVLPPIGGLDLSPLVLLVALQVLERLLL